MPPQTPPPRGDGHGKDDGRRHDGASLPVLRCEELKLTGRSPAKMILRAWPTATAATVEWPIPMESGLFAFERKQTKADASKPRIWQLRAFKLLSAGAVPINAVPQF
ncbi:hypothetical protein GCM10011329_15640 [Stakelama pacifica]|nr:hypothetical protein GCM10011329_15640 [Stakelama pacifica]